MNVFEKMVSDFKRPGKVKSKTKKSDLDFLEAEVPEEPKEDISNQIIGNTIEESRKLAKIRKQISKHHSEVVETAPAEEEDLGIKGSKKKALPEKKKKREKKAQAKVEEK